ncbi:hypothetical protein LEP1GSC170_4202 [Leptospira interrogans serovar Bataviae str. HAI135]|nr:hypothetical protein LEP1GSC170_4202 [Leptospira interrogans serovar Bataviae str. HAI135]
MNGGIEKQKHKRKKHSKLRNRIRLEIKVLCFKIFIVAVKIPNYTSYMN